MECALKIEQATSRNFQPVSLLLAFKRTNTRDIAHSTRETCNINSSSVSSYSCCFVSDTNRHRQDGHLGQRVAVVGGDVRRELAQKRQTVRL